MADPPRYRPASARAVSLPATSVLLDWLRERLPDLRVGYTVSDGIDPETGEPKQLFWMQFTLPGESGDIDPDTARRLPGTDLVGDRDELVLRVANQLRASAGLPPFGAPPLRNVLERAITVAALRGEAIELERLTQELLRHNARPIAEGAIPTRFGKRTT